MWYTHHRTMMSRERRNLEVQGFAGLGDEEARRVSVALRLAPAGTLLLVAGGVLFGVPELLLAALAAELLGVFGLHPAELLLAAPGNGESLHAPGMTAPRRFAFITSATLLALAVWLSLRGELNTAQTLVVLVALIHALALMANISLPAYLWQALTAPERARPGEDVKALRETVMTRVGTVELADEVVVAKSSVVRLRQASGVVRAEKSAAPRAVRVAVKRTRKKRAPSESE